MLNSTNYTDSEGCTALMYAGLQSHSKVLEVLLRVPSITLD